MRTIEEIHARCKEDGDCLIWTGRTNGKGAPKIGSQSVRREYWLLTKGPLTPSELVSPDCTSPCCISHLKKSNKREVAQKANMRLDVVQKKRIKNAETQRAKSKFMTMELAEEIRRTPEISGKEWAHRIGCSEYLISKIRQHKAWSLTQSSNPFAGLFTGFAANDNKGRKRA